MAKTETKTLELIQTPEGVATLLDTQAEQIAKLVIRLDKLTAQVETQASQNVTLDKRVSFLDQSRATSLEQMAKLTARIEELESELGDALEGRMVATEVRSEPRSVNAVLKDEHSSIVADAEPHIEQRMSFGLTREAAEAAVAKRRIHLVRELGLEPKVRTVVKKAAAAIALLLFLLTGSGGLAADYQGYPSTLISLTTLPTWAGVCTAGQVISNGTAIQYSQASQATNYLKLRTRSGLGFQFIFGIPQVLQWTNSSGVWTNATGTWGETTYVYPSVDGTNAVTTAPWAIVSGAPNGTNAVIISTNWSETQLRGYAGLFFTFSNACSLPIITGGTITNIQAGVTNTYPAGPLFNLPNL